MSDNIHLIHLAYLIEISIVLNLAYREIKFVQTGDKLFKEIKEIKNDFKKKEIDVNPFCEEDSNLLYNIFDGDKESWQRHNILRNFYKFLKSGWSIHVVTILIIYDLFLLGFLTFIDNYDYLTSYHSIIWNVSYWTLILSLLLPLYFIFMASKCYKYLFGINYEDDGRVGQLKRRINDRYIRVQAELKTEASTFKVDSEDPD